MEMLYCFYFYYWTFCCNYNHGLYSYDHLLSLFYLCVVCYFRVCVKMCVCVGNAGFRIRQIKKKKLFYIAQFCYNSLFNNGSVVDKFPALTFWILVHFQVDPYPKYPDPQVKMWRLRNPGVKYLINLSHILRPYSMLKNGTFRHYFHPNKCFAILMQFLDLSSHITYRNFKNTVLFSRPSYYIFSMTL